MTATTGTSQLPDLSEEPARTEAAEGKFRTHPLGRPPVGARATKRAYEAAIGAFLAVLDRAEVDGPGNEVWSSATPAHSAKNDPPRIQDSPGRLAGRADIGPRDEQQETDQKRAQ